MCSTPFKHTNLAIVISGPSGCGKSTVAKALCEADSTLRLSISATTRTARPDEVDGVNYHFLTRETFEEQIKQNAFLEWAKYTMTTTMALLNLKLKQRRMTTKILF